MNTRKVTSIYELTVPEAQQKTLGFFTPHKELYFRTEEEAVLYQEHFSIQSKSHPKKRIAAIEQDSDGRQRWILLNKKEDMNTSHYISKGSSSSYDYDIVYYKTTQELEKAIEMNPESVIAVYEWYADKEKYHEMYDSWRKITKTYDAAENINQNTRYLYVSGKERWFVEPEHSISLTDATYLKVQQDLFINQSKLQDLAREKEQYLHAHEKKVAEALQQQKELFQECQQFDVDKHFHLTYKRN